MKVCIRAHDLGVSGTEQILSRLDSLGIDGVQMVCYKAYPDIAQTPGAITRDKAIRIGKDFADAGKVIPLVGAYFNPIHEFPFIKWFFSDKIYASPREIISHG